MRRNDSLMQSKIEHVITSAMTALQEFPSDERLTKAEICLMQAKNYISDYIDSRIQD